MKNPLAFLSLAVALVALVVALGHSGPGPGAESKRESHYQRVMRTKTLRCGYVVSEPSIIKAPAGELGGAVHAIVEEAAKSLGLSVAWTEEVSWADNVPGLRAGRYDAVCTDYWQNPLEAPHVAYSTPLYYEGVGLYVRQNDRRFDGDLAPLNAPGVTFGGTDGSLNSRIAREDFPKAKLVEYPANTTTGQFFQNLVAKKVDAVLASNAAAQGFMRANPGAIRNLISTKPQRIFPAVIALPQGEPELKSMLDAAFIHLVNNGRVEAILRETTARVSGGFYLATKPYVATPVE